MKLTIEVNNCKECPQLTYTHDGYQCRELPLKDSFVLLDGGKNNIPKRCPINKGDK